MVLSSLFLPLLITLLLDFSPISAEKETCVLERKIVTELEKLYDIKVPRANLTISYDIDDINITAITAKTIKVEFHKANGTFEGLVQQKKHGQPEYVNVNFGTKPIYVQRKREFVNNKDQIECKIVDSENFELSRPNRENEIGNVPQEVEAVIIQLTEYCVESLTCKQFGAIVRNDLVVRRKYKPNSPSKNSQPTSNFQLNRALIPKIPLRNSQQNNCLKNPKDIKSTPRKDYSSSNSVYNPQPTINALADFGLSVLVSQIAADHNGTVVIPEIFENFTTAGFSFLPTGDFITSNGTFTDLKTLRRIGNIILKNDKQRFSIATTVRLGRVNVQFNSYSIRYGLLKIKGELAVNIDGITLEVDMALNFNAKPCRVEIVKLENPEFGDVNVAVSGVGVLNRSAAFFIEQAIKHKAFEIIKNEITNRFKDFNCEKYRPKIYV